MLVSDEQPAVAMANEKGKKRGTVGVQIVAKRTTVTQRASSIKAKASNE